MSFEVTSESELMVLAKLFDPAFLTTHRKLIKPELFTFNGPHRALMHAALDTHDEYGKSDPMIALERVANVGSYSREQVAGVIGELTVWDAFHSDRATIALRELQKRTARLTLESRIQEAAQMVSSSAPTLEICQHLSEIANGIQPYQHVDTSSLANVMDSDPSAEPAMFIHTGIPWFDAAMPDGGLQRGFKLAISAPPKYGKSALAAQLTGAALIRNPDLHVLWCMGEMTPRILRNRLWQCFSNIASGILKRPVEDLTPLQVLAKERGRQQLKCIQDRLHFLQMPLTPSRIEQALVKHGALWCVVDYVQLCRPDDRGNTRRDDIDKVVAEFVRISQQHGVVMLWISDMASGATVGRTIFSSFKESGEIPYAADLCYVGALITGHGEEREMTVEDESHESLEMRWRCLASRHGAQKSIVTRFHRFTQRFEGAIA